MKNAVQSYIIGFILSIIFTLFSYFSVTNHLLAGDNLIAAIFGFAMLQFFVQLYFFLHIGKEANPKWNLLFFIATIGIILLVVVGSLWIMHHLNYNMTGPQMEHAIIKEEGFPK